MIDFVGRPFFLVQHGNRIGDEVHRHDIDARCRPEGKSRKPGQEDERANHVELVRLRTAAISQHDAWPENRALDVW